MPSVEDQTSLNPLPPKTQSIPSSTAAPLLWRAFHCALAVVCVQFCPSPEYQTSRWPLPPMSQSLLSYTRQECPSLADHGAAGVTCFQWLPSAEDHTSLKKRFGTWSARPELSAPPSTQSLLLKTVTA